MVALAFAVGARALECGAWPGERSQCGFVLYNLEVPWWLGCLRGSGGRLSVRILRQRSQGRGFSLASVRVVGAMFSQAFPPGPH